LEGGAGRGEGERLESRLRACRCCHSAVYSRGGERTTMRAERERVRAATPSRLEPTNPSLRSFGRGEHMYFCLPQISPRCSHVHSTFRHLSLTVIEHARRAFMMSRFTSSLSLGFCVPLKNKAGNGRSELLLTYTSSRTAPSTSPRLLATPSDRPSTAPTAFEIRRRELGISRAEFLITKTSERRT
jgi:hypothetical protein